MKNGIRLSFIMGLVLLFVAPNLKAQDDKSKRKSPPDHITQNVRGLEVNIDYSQPSVNGRSIFGDLVPYDKMWRLGANEATTLEVDKNCKIAGKEVPAGKYAMFAIPKENGNWTIILNKNWDQWGTYDYDESQDLIRFEANQKKEDDLTEKLTIRCSERGQVDIRWEKTYVYFGISY